jgi:pimeloyl-ACP methyl ester carboxylesterase
VLRVEPRPVAFDVVGAGPPVVLIHSDVADARLWDAQVEALAPSHLVVTYDRPGFGRTPLPPGPYSPVADLLALLDGFELALVSLVGCSGGGNVALEFALTHPERVDRLVLIAPGLPGWDWSAEMKAADEEETRLFEAGDDAAAADAQVRLWADGQRSPDEVDPGLREYTREAVVQSYRHYRDALEQGEPGPAERLDPPASERLGDVRAPTLVVVGAADVADMHGIADRLAAGIPDARKEVVPEAAHMLPLERPDELNRLLREFLA